MGRFLERLGRSSARHRGRVLLGLGIVLLLSAGAASRLDLDADVMSLLPSDDPVVESFRETLEVFGSVDRLLVVVRVPEGASSAPYEEFVDLLGEEMSKLEEIAAVEYEVGRVEDLLAEVIRRAPLFLDARGLRRLEERLTPPGMHRRVAELRRMLTTPSAVGREEIAVLDPLGLLELVSESWDGGRTMPSGAGLDITGGHFLSPDARRLLLIAEPVRPAQDIAFDRRLVEAVEGAVVDAADRWRDRVAESGDRPPAPDVALGGGHVIALEDATMIRTDMAVSGLTALTLVLALFAWSFRRLGPLVVAVVPLACGVVATFGFAAVAMGRVGMATSGVAALLIGLAIDFVIVSYARYLEEVDRGESVEEPPLGAIGRMMRGSGPAVVVGAVTSAATFFAFVVTDFHGLRQMGILTGIGILLCVVAVLTGLPALLAWRRWSESRSPGRGIRGIHVAVAARLVRLSLRRPAPVLLAGLVLTATALVLAVDVELEDDIEALRSPSNRGIQVAEEVARHFGVGFDHASVILAAEELEPLVATTAEAVDRLDSLVEEGIVGGIEAVTDLLPPPRKQRRAIDWLEEHRDRLADPVRVRGDLQAALREAGLRPSGFEAGLELLEAALSLERPLSLDASAVEENELLASYLARREGGWQSLVKVFPPADSSWDAGPPPAVARALETGGIEFSLTSAGLVSEHLRRRVLDDATVAGLVGLVAVALLLWIDLRSLSHAALSLAPLAVGVVWMLGAMVMLDVSLNFMSIFVVTMIIGIGVDYGVHVIHRWREGGDQSSTVPETGKAVMLAALSTVAGFGSMTLSRYPGLQSTGKVALIGALATALVAMTLLPAALSLLGRSGRRSPSRSSR